MASSAIELKLGVFGVFANHTHRNKCKQDASTIFARSTAFHVFVFTLRPQYIMQLINHSYFDLITEKIQMSPIFGAPCWDKDGAGSGISDLYLWFRHNYDP